jgi:NADH-quinone oxidoreductase subunit H
VSELVQILVFPGFIFLFVYAMFVEWVDRKAYALMQNRVGPPWFQPFADFIKLMAKEYIVPERGNGFFFLVLPTTMLAAVLTAVVSIPIANAAAIYSFEGDILVVTFLLSMVSMMVFMIGWFSNSSFSVVGATRAISQMISYEVPMLVSVLTPAILAGSWKISEIAAFFRANPVFLLFQLVALGVGLIAAQAKLERTPFDIPEDHAGERPARHAWTQRVASHPPGDRGRYRAAIHGTAPRGPAARAAALERRTE